MVGRGFPDSFGRETECGIEIQSLLERVSICFGLSNIGSSSFQPRYCSWDLRSYVFRRRGVRKQVVFSDGIGGGNRTDEGIHGTTLGFASAFFFGQEL